MKKIIILIPVYNDWESLKKLIVEISENIKLFNDISFECLIVNDASPTKPSNLIKPSNNPEIVTVKIPIIIAPVIFLIDSIKIKRKPIAERKVSIFFKSPKLKKVASF